MAPEVENTKARPLFVSRADNGWHVLVHVLPGAKKSEFSGLRDDRLRVRLAAPAVEGKANKALLTFVARALGLKPARVLLVSGECGRQKRLLIRVDEEPDWALLGFAGLASDREK